MTVSPYLQTAVTRVLEELGVDTDNEHMAKTPERWATLLWELTHPDPVAFTTFDNTDKVDEMVVIKDISFYTLCAHHIIPFFGKAHIGYIPGSKIAGLSKFARVVRQAARGLWVQEHLGVAIADTLTAGLVDPVGVAVVLEAEHLCMAMRGVQVQNARTTTSVMRGAFLDPNKQARAEFLALIRG
jgi:GTP cyclohydrolase I